jgi:hypothetical protein
MATSFEFEGRTIASKQGPLVFFYEIESSQHMACIQRAFPKSKVARMTLRVKGHREGEASVEIRDEYEDTLMEWDFDTIQPKQLLEEFALWLWEASH